MRAQGAREAAQKAIRDADRAEARRGRSACYGGPAQASPAIGQCLNVGLGWLEVECNRRRTGGEPAARRDQASP
jgi:hypothetical protein